MVSAAVGGGWHNHSKRLQSVTKAVEGRSHGKEESGWVAGWIHERWWWGLRIQSFLAHKVWRVISTVDAEHCNTGLQGSLSARSTCYPCVCELGWG